MSVDDWEGEWKLEGEVREVSDRVHVEERYLKCVGMFAYLNKDRGVDGRSDEDERIWGEDLVFGDEGFEGLSRR
jgi:hypothetical protein